MPTINELLADESIDLAATADSWEDAIRQAGRLLSATGNVDPSYTEAMVESVKNNGPYIVVAPGFAFAHARPSSAVRKTTVSWLHLTEAVEFGHPKNDPVRIVVALAALDSTSHQQAMADIATVLSKRREELDAALTPAQLRQVLGGTAPTPATTDTDTDTASYSTEPKNKILTVCGNGLGTSLFLKNTLEDVLGTWGWAPFINVEATDTISAKGKAKEADVILTSGEIARTLGDLGVPVYIIEDFTSTGEVDSALRELYDI
ncbi:PTS sugar transporter subunit IIA [Corynebacterium mayonis]|uniref:PTS sugar transporter subunit IIA n=1 Tax=Corynebacterium mayonis TaxID=3062461 RepID=UPI003140BAF2